MCNVQEHESGMVTQPILMRHRIRHHIDNDKLEEEVNRLLQPLDSSSSGTVIYDASTGQKFTCSDYPALNRLLAKFLFQFYSNRYLMIDWTHCLTHPLIFHIDIRNSRDNTYHYLIRYYDTFIEVLQHYLPLDDVTVILSMRRSRSGGMCIHIVGVEIAHDDYVYLCRLMRYKCEKEDNGVSLTLDCPSSACLVECTKPEDRLGPYEPIHLIRYKKFSEWWTTRIVQYTKYTNNNNYSAHMYLRYSCSLLSDEEYFNLRQEIEDSACRMSPVPQEGNPNVIYLEFPTRLVLGFDIFYFQFTYEDRMAGLQKDNHLSIRPSAGAGSFGYNFLKEKSDIIKDVHSIENRALKTWYDRFSTRNTPGKLKTADQTNKEKWRFFRYHSPSLLHTFLLLPERVLHTFYVIYNVWKREHGPKAVAEEMSRLLPEKMKTLLAPEDSLSLNTILYMGLTNFLDKKCWKKEYKTL